jgi:hypothetical protein
MYTAPGPAGPWVKLSDIAPYFNASRQWGQRLVEDAFLWVDKRGHFHIVNHAYNQTEISHCGRSAVSAHAFSRDGKVWQVSGRHRVQSGEIVSSIHALLGLL